MVRRWAYVHRGTAHVASRGKVVPKARQNRATSNLSIIMPLTLRPLQPTDAQALVALLPDLGYEATADQVVQRLDALRAWPDQEAFVAEIDGTVVGLCHVQGIRMLISDGYAEIQALVVAAGRQGEGLGRKLVAHACAWAFARGYGRVRLRSNVAREEAHAFYEHLGFEKAKASYAFELRRP